MQNLNRGERLYVFSYFRTAIDTITAEFPKLTGHGWGVSDDGMRVLYAGPQFERERLNFGHDGVATALLYLRRCKHAKKLTGSYTLKHEAERWGRHNGMAPYVSNGELMLAALFLDFNVKTSERSINADIGISFADVQRLHRECDRAEQL